MLLDGAAECLPGCGPGGRGGAVGVTVPFASPGGRAPAALGTGPRTRRDPLLAGRAVPPPARLWRTATNGRRMRLRRAKLWHLPRSI